MDTEQIDELRTILLQKAEYYRTGPNADHAVFKALIELESALSQLLKSGK